jgi:outer membrane protein assembly factor BamA
VFALQLSGGVATGSTIFRDYATGGYTAQPFEETFSSFIGAAHQSPIVLRGYPPAAFGGNQYNLLNLEYRFPIAYVQRGIYTLPLFFSHVSGALFLDYGGAFDSLNLQDPWSNYHAGIGGQLHFGFTLGYFLDTSLTVGWARALDRRAIPNDPPSQTYVVVAASF